MCIYFLYILKISFIYFNRSRRCTVIKIRDTDTETCFEERTGNNQEGQVLQAIPKESIHGQAVILVDWSHMAERTHLDPLCCFGYIIWFIVHSDILFQ